MATIGGGYAVANAIAFGMPDASTQSYFAERINNLVTMGASSGFTEGFLNTAVNIVKSLNADNIIDRASALVNKIKGFFRPNVVSYINTVEDFQVAGSVMQNYLMADPVVRERYQEQRLNGYQDTYVDPWPHLPTLQHPDYRDVMSGITQVESDGTSYRVDYFHSRMEAGDHDPDRLSTVQKSYIINSRERLREFLTAEEKDPTDQWNGNL